MRYQPIENYGVIGNMRTVALVGMNGSIDWFAWPHFDSPSIFAAILDEDKGGYYKIAPTANGVTQKQLYWPETNVLVTRFLSPDGVAEVIDFMPIGTHHGPTESNQLIRQVNVVRGSMHFKMECYPAFNFARDSHDIKIHDSGAIFYSPGVNLQLSTTVPLTQSDKGITAEFDLHEGQTVSFALEDLDSVSEDDHPFSEPEANKFLDGIYRDF